MSNRPDKHELTEVEMPGCPLSNRLDPAASQHSTWRSGDPDKHELTEARKSLKNQ